MKAHSVMGLVMGMASAAALACLEGPIRGEAVTIEREAGATPAGGAAAIQVLGGGFFHAAAVVKQGGADDNTLVTIELDGERVFSNSFSTLKNPWMQMGSRYFLAEVRSEGDTSTMTIWYSPELKFRRIMTMRIGVGEDGVQNLRLRAVMNKPAPHEHPAGQAAASLTQ
jgi:hypothetical protein